MTTYRTFVRGKDNKKRKNNKNPTPPSYFDPFAY